MVSLLALALWLLRFDAAAVLLFVATLLSVLRGTPDSARTGTKRSR